MVHPRAWVMEDDALACSESHWHKLCPTMKTCTFFCGFFDLLKIQFLVMESDFPNYMNRITCHCVPAVLQVLDICTLKCQKVNPSLHHKLVVLFLCFTF